MHVEADYKLHPEEIFMRDNTPNVHVQYYDCLNSSCSPFQVKMSSMMRAIGVSSYGGIENLQSRDVPRPPQPQGRQMLVQVKAISVNPVDTKIRKGNYDDAPDYYEHVRPHTLDSQGFHILGYDGAGIVKSIGPEVKDFKPGDEVFYLANIAGQGTNGEEAIIDERHSAHKPRSVDFVQAAVMPLTYGTAYEAMVARMKIPKEERAAILIINGGGGVGSISCQIARHVLKLPVVIATASRPETREFTKENGATHVVNHREDIVKQIKDLNVPMDIPLKYAFITSRTEQYIKPIGDLLAPFGTVCSIVQARFDMYGSQFMSKSLTFVWCWVGTGPFHKYVHDDPDKHHRWYEELAQLMAQGVIKPHLTQRLKLTAANIREVHGILEAGKAVGKIGLGVDEPGDGTPFQ
jgi:zinc-binding alcohol dehydrogenase family protein